MRLTRSLPGFLAIAAVVALSRTAGAAAQERDVVESKGYFKAGAAAYEMGDYAAAIQALDAAYRLTPLPAIAFSLAQAERRQYFVSRERIHLDRALELYRMYLQQVTSGGRRADATDALGQLEPLALATGSAASPEAPAPERTRLMISCGAPNATVSLDGAPASPAPLIAQVTPGPHRVFVAAEGFFPGDRSVEAIAGELVPLEISLREQPAVVELRAASGADLHVDGSFVGSVRSSKRLELPSGEHLFSFAKNGHELEAVRAHLPPGSTRTIVADLEQTGQRTAALVLFVISGVGLGSAAVLTALAVDHENVANDILARRETGNISRDQLRDYGQELEARGRFRAAAITGFAVSAASLVTGLFLFALDQPDLREPVSASSDASIRVGAPLPGATEAWSVEGRLRF